MLAKAVDRNALDDALTSEDKERVLDMLAAYGGLNPDRLHVGSSAAATGGRGSTPASRLVR